MVVVLKARSSILDDAFIVCCLQFSGCNYPAFLVLLLLSFDDDDDDDDNGCLSFGFLFDFKYFIFVNSYS